MQGIRIPVLALICALLTPLAVAAAEEAAESTPPGVKKLEVSRLKPALLTFKGLVKVSIYNSDIATVMILSDDQVAIEGRSPGTTLVEVTRLEGDEEKTDKIEVTVAGVRAQETPSTGDRPDAATDTGAKPDTTADTGTSPAADTGTKPTETDTGATPEASAATDTGRATDTGAEPDTTGTGVGNETPEIGAATTPAEVEPTRMVAVAADTGKETVTAEEIGEAPAAPPAAGSKPSLFLGMSVSESEEGSGVLNYAITVGNRGPGDATEVVVRDVIPSEVVYVAGSATENGQYSEVTRELEWRLPSLKAGEEIADRVGFQARLAEGVSRSATIHNVATCECKELDTMIASNTTSHTVSSSALVAIFALPDVVLARKRLDTPLQDVRGDEYRRAVDRLEGLGIVHGYPDRTFKPDAAVNRAESTKMIVTAVNLKEFRDRTRLTYVLSRDAKVTLTLRNKEGQAVRTLVSGEQKTAGDHAVEWDGLDASGEPVPFGAYEYHVTTTDAEGHTSTLMSGLTVVALQDTELKGAPTFKDVVPTNWYAGYVAEAENREYVRGYPDNTFRPHREITRAETTAIVVRALGMEDQAQERKGTDVGFLDQDEIPPWATGYVAVATTEAPKAGGQLIVGYPGNTFQARNPIKRAEAAAMIERFVDRDLKLETSVAGAVMPGASITLNGHVVQGGPHGHFRERISFTPDGMNTIAVLTK